MSALPTEGGQAPAKAKLLWEKGGARMRADVFLDKEKRSKAFLCSDVVEIRGIEPLTS